MKTAGSKPQMPVSKKFYASILDRVATALSIVRPTNHKYLSDRTMEMIDRYLLSGASPDKDEQFDCVLIFHLLRPEIDKAIERSRRSRESALRRKANKLQMETTETSHNPSDYLHDPADNNAFSDTSTIADCQTIPTKPKRRQRSYSRRCFP